MSNSMTKKTLIHTQTYNAFSEMYAFGMDDTIERGMQTLTKSLSIS